MTVALYQKGKEFVWEGLDLVMKVVDEVEVEAHRALGWVLHPYDTIEVAAAEAPTPIVPEPAAPVAPAPEPVQTPLEPVAVVPVNPFAPK